jgi:hypothetical protein
MSRRDLAVPLALFCFACALYANALGNGFAHDDRLLILENPSIHSLENFPAWFSSDYWGSVDSRLYRPLSVFSYALNYAFGDLDPRGYHGVNIALHGAIVVLVWFVSLAVFQSGSVAAASALLFAALAVHTEAVTGIGAGRPELLCALFFLLSFGCHVLRSGPRARSTVLYKTSLIASFLALLSKESGFTLVAVIFLYDVSFLRSRQEGLMAGIWWTVRMRFRSVYAGYLVVAAAALAIRFAVFSGVDILPTVPFEDNPLVELGGPHRVLNALAIAWRYVGLLVFPCRLSYDYSFNQIPLFHSIAAPIPVLVLLCSGALAWLTLRSHRFSREVFFAIGCSLATFSLISNAIVPIGTIMAERLLYLPSLGFCWLVALGARWISQRFRIAGMKAGVVQALVIFAVVGLNGWRTVLRNADWYTAERLFLHDVSVSPNSAKAQLNAGIAHQLTGSDPDAIEHYERAIEIMEGRPTDAYNNLGFLLVDREIDVLRGIALLEQARQMMPRDVAILDSLAWGYHKAGHPRKAHRLLIEAFSIPASPAQAENRRVHLEAVEAVLARRAKPSHQKLPEPGPPSQ